MKRQNHRPFPWFWQEAEGRDRRQARLHALYLAQWAGHGFQSWARPNNEISEKEMKLSHSNSIKKNKILRYKFNQGSDRPVH